MSSNLLDQLYSERDDLLTALKAAKGYMMNVMIDLETGTPKTTTLSTLKGGIKLVSTAIDKMDNEAVPK